ncbi:hypothetical protein HY995_03420 [Candidatus Micrarchaeota archaeon]|nr:hypothetical protein [Candidatus Micrarchaeota archaeon]MBI5177110.1 hypothetical protein [Candidatus Micrarchaeota archaeon]
MEEIIVFGLGSVLACSALLALALHYYSTKADDHFSRADARIRHAESLLREADGMVINARRELKNKVSVHHAEAKISKAIAELLTAMEEEKKAKSTVRQKKK